MRYQVDRKFRAASLLKTLKTLELSEVLAEDAERLKPPEPEDMRQ